MGWDGIVWGGVGWGGEITDVLRKGVGETQPCGEAAGHVRPGRLAHPTIERRGDP